MAKAWKEGAAGAPSFASDFEVLKKAVLQVTDIKTNRNKYYAIELHQAQGGGGDHPFRVYTHYGRTDDLEANPNAGVRESRFFGSRGEAEAQYTKIYKQKTSKRKGYKEVDLASSRIGSHKARGTSSGHVDAKTLERLEGEKDGKGKKAKAKKPKPSQLPGPVQELVQYLYDEATNALTQTVQARITANGIETPLGVLTVGQVEKGERILDSAYDVYQEYAETSGAAKRARLHDRLTDLSGEFFTMIPHRIGRSRHAVKRAVLDTLEEFQVYIRRIGPKIRT